WPSKLIVPVALSLLAIRLAIQLWGYIRLAINPQAEPIAVPVIKDVAEVAREEIREVLHDDFDRPDDHNRPDDGERRDRGGSAIRTHVTVASPRASPSS